SRIAVRSTLIRLGFVAVTGAAVLAQYVSGFRSSHGPLRWGLPIACFVFALALQHKARPIRVPRPLLWLGEISFSLYLVQRIPQMALMTRFPQASFFHGIAYFWIGTLMVLALAWASYLVLVRWLSERVRVWLLARLR